MVCLNSQTLTLDASELVTRDDGKVVTLREIQNPEDVSARNEVNLLFPAQPINQLLGFLF